MIVHVNKTGTGFKGTVLYLLHGHLDALNPDRVEWIESRNLPTRNAMAAVRIMAATARDSGSRQAPVYHISISFDPDDPVDRATMIQVADRLLRDLDLEEHQALIVSHKDRAHPHLHLVVNRVHPERLTVWSNWYDFPRIERSLRAQEVELGLRVVPGRNAIVPHTAELRPQPRLHRGDAAFLREVQERAGPVLKRAQSWAELERDLAAVGLSVRVNGRGMSVTDGEQVVKASEIDRAFSRNHLEKRMGIYGEYRALLAAPGRAATPPPAQSVSEESPASAQPQEDSAGDVAAAGPALEPERLTESAGVELLSSSEPTNLTPLTSSGTDETRPADQSAADGPVQLDLLTGVDDSQVGRDDVSAPHPVLADQLDQAGGPVQLDLPLAPETPHLRPEIALQDTPRTSASAPVQGELTLLDGTPATPKSSRSSRDQQHASARPVAPDRPAEPLQESPPARPTAPVAAAPQIDERPSPSSDRKISPDLLRVRELIRESGDWYRATDAAYDAIDATAVAGRELERLQGLDRTAVADAKLLWSALFSVYLNPSDAALELSRFRCANGEMATRYALMQTPQRFGNLRGVRFWYTRGPGRKYVENVLDPLENAVRSEQERPTQAELDAAGARLQNAVKLHVAARDARDALRNPDVCEREAAGLLQPLLGKLSAEEIAELLAALLPPEDREGAKLIERIIKLAISLNNMLSRQSYRGRELG